MLIGIVLLWPVLQLSEFKPWVLFDAGNARVMANFLAGFVPPATSSDFLGLLLKATLETLAMATAGIALAFVIAIPLAFAMTYSLSISRIGPGPGPNGSVFNNGINTDGTVSAIDLPVSTTVANLWTATVARNDQFNRAFDRD